MFKNWLERRKDGSNRDKWSNNTEYFLSCLGYCVGFGNVWRFPYLCYRNGGGAFLIPYFVFGLLVAMPMYFIELALGQYTRSGPIKYMDKIAPIMKGVGVASTLILAYGLVYYILIVAWVLVYMFHTFTLQELPWMTCDNWWNTNSCVTLHLATNQTSNTTKVTLSTEEFFNNNVLQMSKGIDDIGTITNWKLILCFILSWVICYFVLFKGLKLTGKVVYFTALFPYVILTVLAVRGCMLPGASDGLKYFLYPNFTKLKDLNVWVEGSSQVLYSYGVCVAVLIAFGSYSDHKTDSLRLSLIITSACSLTSLYSGVGVFSVLGYLAHVTNQNVSDVVNSGPGLLFQTIPGALSLMPLPQLWTFLFLFMMLLIGIDSVFASMEGVVSALGDYMPGIVYVKSRRQWFMLCACIAIALPGIPMTFGCGIYIFEIFNHYSAAGFCVYTVTFFECVTVAYMYGANKFCGNVKSMIGYMPPKFFNFCFLVTVPLLTLSALLVAIIQHKPLALSWYTYPQWAHVFGWMLALSSVLCIPVCFIYLLIKADGNNLLLKYKSATTTPFAGSDLSMENVKLNQNI